MKPGRVPRMVLLAVLGFDPAQNMTKYKSIESTNIAEM